VFELLSRVPLEVDIIRDRNALYRETNDGLIENVYTLKILNKSQHTQHFDISVNGLDGYKYIGDSSVTVMGGEVYNLPISIAIDPYKLEKPVTAFSFTIQSREVEEAVIEQTSKFLYR
jgi:polyferredoxin